MEFSDDRYASEASEPRFAPLDWAALWDSTAPAEDWLVEPLIGRGRLVSLYSAPGAGKSLLALEIAAALASGGNALGNSFQRPLSVVYVDHENDPRSDVVTRLKDFGYSPRHLTRLHYFSFPPMAPLDSALGGSQLVDLALDIAADLVVIDTVSRTVAGEENANDTWLSLYRHTTRQLKAHRIACLRLDHAGKDAAKGQRGGSAKSGDVDALWRLTEVARGTTLRLDCEKSRQSIPEDSKTITLHRRLDPLRHDVADDPRRAARIARIDNLVDALDRLNVPADAGAPTARKALRDAGISAGNADIGQAVQRRKLSAPSRGQRPESGQPNHADTLWTASEQDHA